MCQIKTREHNITFYPLYTYCVVFILIVYIMNWALLFTILFFVIIIIVGVLVFYLTKTPSIPLPTTYTNRDNTKVLQTIDITSNTEQHLDIDDKYNPRNTAFTIKNIFLYKSGSDYNYSFQ